MCIIPNGLFISVSSKPTAIDLEIFWCRGECFILSYYPRHGMSPIDEGDDVLLYLDRRRTYMVKIEGGKQFHTHKGYIDLGDIIGKPYGSPLVSSLGVTFHALKPLIRDRILKTNRRTQVLYPKDIGFLLLQLNVGSGSRVVEAGQEVELSQWHWQTLLGLKG